MGLGRAQGVQHRSGGAGLTWSFRSEAPHPGLTSGGGGGGGAPQCESDLSCPSWVECMAMAGSPR